MVTINCQPSLPITKTKAMQTIVLVGLESVGKSALFRNLTGQATGDETNVRGSTVRLRHATIQQSNVTLIDTPGLRSHDDSQTTRMALGEATSADVVLLVARGTHLKQEIDTLLREVGPALQGQRAALAITFEDRAALGLPGAIHEITTRYGIPVIAVNARQMNETQRGQILQAITAARPFALAKTRQPILLLPDMAVVQPQATLFERRGLGPWLALLSMLLLYGLPVYAAYHFAQWAQSWVDGTLIMPLKVWLAPLQLALPLLYALLAGSYGLLTLGWYSFLWAFPVVVFIAIATALADESGLKDRVTAALDPWLRRIGLNGRDLAPVLTGFGCNVVAVFQSRACSRCTRKACVTLITFGSACSYQIGASLSLFNAAHAPWLFAPYLFVLFLVAALHTRFWHGALPADVAIPLTERAFLQTPTWRAIWWRIRVVLNQFLREAMPIFLAICLAGAALDYYGLLAWLADGIAPLLVPFHLPAAVAPGLIFSMIRKDGLLALNQDGGALLATLSVGQIFVLVYLASTLTACMVTLWTVRNELGVAEALAVAGKQALTSLVTALLLSTIIASTIF